MRRQVSDRAILHAMHFLGDNENVVHQVAALEKGDFQNFLELVNKSGNSSFKGLQNIYTIKNVHEQSFSLALTLTENFIDQIGEGACRIHRGGFAGTIQAYIPKTAVENHKQLIESIFGEEKLMALSIRPYGTVSLYELDC